MFLKKKTGKAFCNRQPSPFDIRRQKIEEVNVLAKVLTVVVKFNFAILPGLFQMEKELTSKFTGKHFDRNEEFSACGNEPNSVLGKPVPRHQTMNMGMEGQVLSPSVQNCRDPS